MKIILPFRALQRGKHITSPVTRPFTALTVREVQRDQVLSETLQPYPVNHEDDEAHLSKNASCPKKAVIDPLALGVPSSLFLTL